MRKVSNSIPANESPRIGTPVPNICKEIRNQQDECGIGDNYKKLPYDINTSVGNGESGNRGIRESGNPGIGESGNRGIRESGNRGIREPGNRGIQN